MSSQGQSRRRRDARNRLLWRAACGLIGLAAANWAAAGSFGVAPIRVELINEHRVESLTVRNQGDAPLLLQARAMAWSQEAGEDHTADTHELLVTPLIVQIAAHGEQVLRVALRRDADPARELDYRLLLTEVAQADDPQIKTGQGLRVALQLSVPVFVNPASPVKGQLQWQARNLDDGSVQIEAANLGTAHVQVTGFDVLFGAGQSVAHASTIRYLLPGSRVSWTLPTPAGVAPDAPLMVRGLSDAGDFNSEVVRAAGP